MDKTTENIISVLAESTNHDLSDLDFDKSIKDQGIDSLDRMSFFFSLEKAFNIKINTDSQANLHSINDILSYLKNLKT